MSKKTVPGILRFVSMLFLIFEKGNKQKNCAKYFEVRKYTFLIFKKRINKKTVPGILRFVSILFLIFKKGIRNKNCARYFEIRKYTFLIFKKIISKKMC